MSRDWTPDSEDRLPAEVDSRSRNLEAHRTRVHFAFRESSRRDRSQTSDRDELHRSNTIDFDRTYYLRDKALVLRESEFATLMETGRFRVIDTADLVHFAYGADENRMRRDVRHLEQQGLLLRKPVVQDAKPTRNLLTLTKKGKQLLVASGRVPEGHTLYHGIVKPRELKHDASLYRLYQREASRIAESGRRTLRVVLDYELKSRVYCDLAREEAAHHPCHAREHVASCHGLVVVGDKIQIPDLRIEYEAAEGETRHVDLELATRNYRPRALTQKAKAGFSLYAVREDVSKLRRILDESELTARILAL